jgi:nucleotide-binding universal stress UspA family protein
MNDNARERSVVVGVDGSESALHAVRWAAGEARRRNAPLRLVHVSFLAPVRHPKQMAPPPDYRAALLEQGQDWLDDALEAARRTVPGIEAVTDLRAGVVADALIDESSSAQLVVLGSRGLGGFSALLVGSVAIALSAHGHCPIVVIRSSTVDGSPAGSGPVVVGVDGSELSDAALTFAFEAAATRAVPLVVLHTWLDVTMTGSWTALPWMVDWDLVQAEEEKALAEHIAGWCDKYSHVEVRPTVVRGRPDRVLLEHGAGAQLIVVGCRGRGALMGVGLGSVSQTLLHHAECPVAVVRAERT